MHLKIEIEMLNAAFEDPDELARILADAEHWVRAHGKFSGTEIGAGFTLRDINGNTVGEVSLRRWCRPEEKEAPMDAVEPGPGGER